MKLKIALAIILLMPILSISQISIQNTQTPSQLVQNVLLGSGVTAFNIKYNGVPASANLIQPNVTYFNSNGTSFPISSGVLLSSGNGNIAIGPNNNGAAGDSDGTNVINDPDMDAITPNSMTNGVVLEFDFTATGDTINFKYIFGSEEYPNDFGSQFYDVFGFFLSGPGILGPYSNGGVNLATLPGTNTAISILNLNPNVNNQFYTNNENGLAYGTAIQYDGTSILLTSSAKLICGQTYHIKLGICNIGDEALDSGVFLQANSFSSNTISVNSNSDYPGTFVDTLLAEGCTKSNITFIRPHPSPDSVLVVPVTISGTANQSDFATALPDTIVFGLGIDTVVYILDPIQDGNTETNEWIQFLTSSINECGYAISDSVLINITDRYFLTWEIQDTVKAACSNINPTVLVSNFNNSIPDYSFNWSNSSTTNPGVFINSGVNFDTSKVYVDITDGCGNVFQDSAIIINNFEIPEFTINPDTIYNSCLSNQLSSTVVPTLSNYPPYTYLWSNNSTTATVNNLTNSGTNGSSVKYYVMTTNVCGVSTIDSVTIINEFVTPVPSFVPNDTLITTCLLDSMLFTVNATGGTNPFSYLWNDGSTTNTNYMVDTLGINGHVYHFSVTVTNTCNFEDSTINGVMIVNKTLNVNLGSLPSHACINDGQATSTISGSVGTLNYQWIGPSLNGDTMTSQNINNIGAGWYYFTVTDDNCFDNDSIQVAQINAPNANFISNPTSGTAPLTFTFINNSQNATSFDWDFGNGFFNNTNDLSNVTSLYDSAGIYTIMLIATEGPCSDTAYLDIELFYDPEVIVPNIFTPNGDDLNDTYFLTLKAVKTVELKIFDRWGNVVFEENSTNPQWDGKNKNGGEASDGVYFYDFKATGYNDKIVGGKGFLHLQRSEIK